MIDDLHWELTVLSKSIAYKNLSEASSPIGLSQPQLSRIVAKIESELQIVILDRSARRKSGWTPIAFKLAETYTKFSRSLDSAIHGVTAEREPKYLKVGTLEGMGQVASRLCHQILSKTSVKAVELDIYDLHEIEDKFLKGEFDLIFTLREPGKKKYGFVKLLGYQILEKLGERADLKVMSQFEFGTLTHPDRVLRSSKAFVSNSTGLRRDWIRQFGGIGKLPSEIQKRPGTPATTQRALLIGQDQLGPNLWKLIESLK